MNQVFDSWNLAARACEISRVAKSRVAPLFADFLQVLRSLHHAILPEGWHGRCKWGLSRMARQRVAGNNQTTSKNNQAL
jgi:hypothetical protein